MIRYPVDRPIGLYNEGIRELLKPYTTSAIFEEVPQTVAERKRRRVLPDERISSRTLRG
jgi:hypothetical protein